MKKCLKKAMTAIGVVKAMVSRCLFSAHGFICIWRVVVDRRNPLYWCLLCSIPMLVLEGIYTLKKKKGGEWKWVCPSVLLYLATAVPAIWFMELHLLEERIMAAMSAGRPKASQHTPNISLHEKITVWNSEISIPVFFAPGDWCKILEQMMLLVLIIGRWLLPKGEITREQLSQLLLVYIGMAADIIELFEAFKEKEVRCNKILTMVILSIWTASLMQFTFVLTATKSKRRRPVLYHSGSSVSKISVGGKSCCPTEVISILISVLLQDGPFLVMRMMLIFRYGVLSYTNLFFTSKNSLVLILQVYRLLVLFCQKTDHSSIVISNEGTSTSVLDSTVMNGALKASGKQKVIARKLNLQTPQSSPGTLAERRSSLTGQDSIDDSTHTQDTDVNGSKDNMDSITGDMCMRQDDAGTSGVQSQEVDQEDKTKSKKKEKKKKKKKGDNNLKSKQGSSLENTNRWGDVRKMAHALAFLDEAGTCHTVVVNPGANEHTLLIVDKDRNKAPV